MTEHGGDIQIDFFDESPTEEAQGPRLRASRRDGSGPPRRPVQPPAGFTPLLRLAGLVAIAIVTIVVLTAWVQSCRSEGKRDSYREYMDAMRAIAADSEQVGEELNTALTTPGIRLPELRQKLGTLAQQQEQDVARARELAPPGLLRLQHRQAVEALQFRVSGLRRLQDAFQQSANGNPGQAGELLAEQMRRLVASDVIWDDQFKDPAIQILRAEDIGGVEVPDSNFFPNADIATERAMAQVWERIQGAAAAGGTPSGLHGNALVSVRAMPGDQVLSGEEENVVVASADLAFEATVENSGDSQEVRVKVNLEIEQSPRPVRQEQTIDLINPGERKTVRFTDLGQIVQFDQEMTMKVEVEAVPGETNLGNNSGTYTVRFVIVRP